MVFLDKIKEIAEELGIKGKLEKAQKKITEKVAEVSNGEFLGNITSKVNKYMLEEAKKYDPEHTEAREREHDEEILRLASVNMVNVSKAKIAELEAEKNLPVIYTAFVQAHHSLYEPEGYGGAVFVYADDAKKGKDAEFIINVAKKLGDLTDANVVPNDAQKLVDLLNAGDSYFVEEVPTSLTDGVKVYASVRSFDGDEFPKGYMPGNRIIPVYLEGETKIDVHDGLKFIKPKKYLEE